MRIFFTLGFLVIFSATSCSQKNDCTKLPTHFSSYSEALLKIKSSTFKIQEAVNTSKSSWIKGAYYYSCDGKMGYFILATAQKEYIHSNLPYNVWLSFKSAGSFGSFYNSYIKHKYQFAL